MNSDVEYGGPSLIVIRHFHDARHASHMYTLCETNTVLYD